VVLFKLNTSLPQNNEKLQELIHKSSTLIDEVQERLGAPYSMLKETLSGYKNELQDQKIQGNNQSQL
jgi:hypothetical protein